MSAKMSMVTVSASKKKPGGTKGGKKTLRHMLIKPAHNGGATVEHNFMAGDGTEYGPDTPAPETHVFTKPKDVGKHVATMLEGMPGAGMNDAISGDTNGAPPPSQS